MQASTLSGKVNPKAQAFINALNFTYETEGTFKYYCKKLNITHYATRGKYLYIEKQWNLIYNDMVNDIRLHNITINSYLDLVSYLQKKYKMVHYTKRFQYEYILRELNNYTTMGQEFASKSKDYITRLRCYAKARECNTITEVKAELDHFLGRFIVDVDENSKNTYDTQEWLIISRYICDFLEYDDGFSEPFQLFPD